MQFIDLKTQYQSIKTELNAKIQKVLDSGQFILGPEVTELEEKLALRVGAKHCITMSSGTDAILVALMALGVNSGDEVITSAFSFFASAETIALLGAKPVFVDIDARTYNIDVTKIEAAITDKTKAIMPVSLYGQCPDFDIINAIAKKHNLPVIEDAAQSFGATYKNRPSCNLSTIGCTSFFPTKPLGCYGDGGACFTNDAKLAQVMRELRNHGQEQRYYHTSLGINGRLDTLQAAILLAKLEIFDKEIALRIAAGKTYDHYLQNKAKVTVPYIAPHNTCVYAQYTIAVDNRAAVQAHLQKQGIPSMVHYPMSMHKQPVFAAQYQHLTLPAVEEAAQKVLSLPLHPYLTEQEIKTVASFL